MCVTQNTHRERVKERKREEQKNERAKMCV